VVKLSEVENLVLQSLFEKLLLATSIAESLPMLACS
jgi:hypothetical protein